MINERKPCIHWGLVVYLAVIGAVASEYGVHRNVVSMSIGINLAILASCIFGLYLGIVAMFTTGQRDHHTRQCQSPSYSDRPPKFISDQREIVPPPPPPKMP